MRLEKLIQSWKLQLQNSLSRHPEQRLQGAWTCAQLGLFLYPWLPDVGIVGLLLAVAVVWKQQYRTMIRRPLNWGLAILSGWLIITCCFATERVAAFLGLANLLPFFLVFAAYSTLIQNVDQLRQLAKIIVVGSLPVLILGFGQLFLGWAGSEQLQGITGWVIQANGNPSGRMASVFMYANILAAYLQMVLILGLGLWIERFQALRQCGDKSQGVQLLFLTVLVVGNAIALILTNSRNAWAIAILACLGFALYLGWRSLVAGVAAIAGAILWASFGPEPGRQWLRHIVPAFFWARLTDQLYPDRPVAQFRTTQWRFTLWMTQQRPWTGWGLRNFTPLYEAKMHLWLGHPHNLLLMLMAETGIPATLFFCGLIGWVLAQGILLLAVWSDAASLEAKHQRHQDRLQTLHAQQRNRNLSSPTPYFQDRLILFSYLMAFAGCILFNLLDVTLFDLRVNTLNWLVLSAICGLVYRYHPLPLWRNSEKAANSN